MMCRNDIKIIDVMSDYNIVTTELITCHCTVKNIILDIFMWCNEAVVHTHVFRYVSNVFRINLKSWRT